MRRACVFLIVFAACGGAADGLGGADGGGEDAAADASLDTMSSTAVVDASKPRARCGATTTLVTCSDAGPDPYCNRAWNSCSEVIPGPCEWYYACDLQTGMCAAAEQPSCANCRAGESCVAFLARHADTEPCSKHYVCVECDANAPFPYNCADGGL